MGQTSLGGNYVFDRPHLLGSERTGPDLSYIGRKRSEAWEVQHLRLPRTLSPLSIMPNFTDLPDKDLRDIVAYLFAEGDRVAQQRMVPPENTPYLGKTDPDRLSRCRRVQEGVDQGWPSWNAAHLQEGKNIYVTRCMTCHGCAGNGLGSYGGHMVVTPVNFKEDPYAAMPDDEWIWHVSEGVPGHAHAGLEDEPERRRSAGTPSATSSSSSRAPSTGIRPRATCRPPYEGQTNPLPQDGG